MRLPEDFSITKDGIVFGARGKPLKCRIHQGYKKVRIRSGWSCLHRLLAESFIPNPNNLETVNHIDGDKLNNDISNLEWTTRKDNLYHAMDNGLHAWGRTKVINNIGQKFNSQAEAARSLNTYQGNIARSIKTGCKCVGFNWRYL